MRRNWEIKWTRCFCVNKDRLFVVP